MLYRQVQTLLCSGECAGASAAVLPRNPRAPEAYSRARKSVKRFSRAVTIHDSRMTEERGKIHRGIYIYTGLYKKINWHVVIEGH